MRPVFVSIGWLVLAASVTACAKEDAEAKRSGWTPGTAAPSFTPLPEAHTDFVTSAVADDAAAATASASAIPSASPPAPTAKADDVAERALALADGLADDVAKAPDCDQAAVALESFMSANAATLKMLQHEAQQHGDMNGARWQAKYGGRLKSIGAKLTPVVERCKASAKFAAALKEVR